MPADTEVTSADGQLELARRRIRLGPAPAWAVHREYDRAFKGRAGDPCTYLLLNRQTHAELRQTHFHTAVRLETMEAVQKLSQWQVRFEARTQSVTVHWVKIRRGEQEFEHASLERIRVLQREEGLEWLVLDGLFTVLLVLEDVRPGDILETCYTVASDPRLLAEYCFALFSPPAGVSIGRFEYSVQFREARAMDWRSSATDIAPVEWREAGEVLWSWIGEKVVAPKAEENTPDCFVDAPWLHVSDCPDWGKIAGAVAGTWQEQPDDPCIAELAETVQKDSPGLAASVAKAIRLIQDEHRYLSVMFEVGGRVPSAPGTVAQRRFGDCKDLSFLLVHVLKRLGVSARPILVNSSLRHTLLAMLPDPGLFNHVIVEFELQGQTRWVDPTMKRQGGGALDCFAPNFRVGLPVDASATALVQQPPYAADADEYEMRESILLDTTGAVSLLAVNIRAKGSHAENLRHRFETVPIDEVAKERQQICANRFGSARRVGAIQHRDDRAANQFFLAETFEINGFLAPDPHAGFCRLAFQNSWIVSVLRMPEKGPRRTPFALPFPCNINYTFEVQSPTIKPGGGGRANLANSLFEFTKREKCLHGYLSNTVTLQTQTDFVAPPDVAKYREAAEEVWKHCAVDLLIPVGYARPRNPRGFGELPEPPVTTPLAPIVPKLGLDRHSAGAPAGAGEPVLASGSSAVADQPIAFVTPEIPSGRRARAAQHSEGEHRSHRRHKTANPVTTAIVVVGIILALLALFFMLLTRN